MKRIFYVASAAIAAVAFSSCENDPLADVAESTVYLSSGAASSNEVNYVINTDAVSGSEEVIGSASISLKLCAAEAVGADVTAVLKVDESKVASPWTLLPSSAYELTSTTATISKGSAESSDSYSLTLKPEAVADFGSYVLPLTVEITAGKAVLSTSASVLNVKFVRNRLNADVVPASWTRIANDAFTAESYKDSYGDYIGVDYSAYGLGLASAFDSDLSTDWYGTCGYYDGSTYVYSGTAADDYGVWASVNFASPTALKGIIVSANPSSQYYSLRPRRLTVLLKYEGADDYDWDSKAFEAGYQTDSEGNYVVDEYGYYVIDYNVGDDGTYLCISDNSGVNKAEIPGYQKADADYLIGDAQYSNHVIDLSSRVGNKKVVSMILIPATLACYKDEYDSELQDYYYAYYYDYYYGTATTEISLFR
ncbi:MAG: DUF1735 domain-containing protein [Candidatus Cryptobacteroides sp.]